MLLKTIFIRFYKSFNFDYIKQNDQEPDPSKSWDFIDDKWYPYIEVSIETATKVTTIVGANESGKSHLLSAIEKAILGKSLISGKDGEFEEIKREDFCRYSHFFSIKKGELKFPGFGTEWTDVSQPDQQKIRECCNLPDEITFNSFLLFRVNKNDLNVYIKDKDNYRQYKVAQKYLESISSILPNIFRINSQIALPASIPIRRLINQSKKIQLADNDIIQTKFGIFERQQRNEILKLIENLVDNPDSLNEKEGISAIQKISTYRDEITSKIVAELTKGKNLLKKQDKRFKLAYDLLCDVSGVDPEILSDLAEALINGKEGYANGIIEMINSRLTERLNFPRWWVQDQEFCLRIAPRDYDLVFTIRDKTGTEYSITERSNGLTYFLSYFIQFLSHKPHPEKNEILLMDEPDAYLSSQAQQDLLKIFDAFSNPQDGSHITRPIQVVYVTHSPFLIDKNHAERIRVLEKGKNDEGTRVVKDIARNHYEPLRSAFGAFVGETTLIGNCNLMVEGAADQILIAGAATYLRNCTETKIETLDLNTVTIVPADSASQIPYLVYLARGRDVEQPAVIVLLDSNQSGNNAKIQLIKGVPSRKNLLPEEFIIQIAEMQSGITLSHGITLTDLEDLIPLPICVEAARRHAKEVYGATDKDVALIKEDTVLKKITTGQTIFDAMEACFREKLIYKEVYIDKISLSRSVINLINILNLSRKNGEKNSLFSELSIFETNFKFLFKYLNDKIRKAREKLHDESISDRVERYKRRFFRDYPLSTRREDARDLLATIEDLLIEETEETERIKKQIQNLLHTYKLEIEMYKIIDRDDYEEFKKGLEKIKYAGRVVSQENKFNQ